MDTEVVAAIISSVVSLLVAGGSLAWTHRNEARLEQLRDEIAGKAAARNARLEYEFDARKRLYEVCGPLLFQLSELGERAFGRIIGLARTAANGDLEPPKSWLGHGHGYYSLSTYYWLIAPLSIGKLLQRKLTHVDLSLDPAVHWQYELLRCLGDSFTDHFEIAGSETSYIKLDKEDWIPYQPYQTSEALQGIPRGVLDNAASVLITKDADGTERVMEFREFEDWRTRKTKSAVREAFDDIDYLFAGFHPRTRPVLWRILVAQAHLYGAIIVARSADRPDPGIWDTLWSPDRPPAFDWRNADERGVISDDDVAVAVRVAASYVRQKTSRVLGKLSQQAGTVDSST